MQERLTPRQVPPPTPVNLFIPFLLTIPARRKSLFPGFGGASNTRGREKKRCAAPGSLHSPFRVLPQLMQLPRRALFSEQPDDLGCVEDFHLALRFEPPVVGPGRAQRSIF